MRLKIKDCVMIDCVSFTFVSVLLSILNVSPKLMGDVNNIFILQLFFSTSLISIGMYFISKICKDSKLLFELLNFIYVVAVILFFGGIVFKWFPLSVIYAGEIIFICALAFGVTNAVMLWQDKTTERKINKILTEKEKNGKCD